MHERELLAVCDELAVFHGLQQRGDVLDHIGDAARRHFDAEFRHAAVQRETQGEPQRHAGDGHEPRRLGCAGDTSGISQSADFLQQVELPALRSAGALVVLLPHEQVKRAGRAHGRLPGNQACGSATDTVRGAVTVVGRGEVIRMFVVRHDQRDDMLAHAPEPAVCGACAR